MFVFNFHSLLVTPIVLYIPRWQAASKAKGWGAWFPVICQQGAGASSAVAVI